VILRILRIEVGLSEWSAEVQVLVPIVLHELVIPVVDSDPYQDLALDILIDDKPVTSYEPDVRGPIGDELIYCCPLTRMSLLTDFHTFDTA
jgi:hypothetical protein